MFILFFFFDIITRLIYYAHIKLIDVGLFPVYIFSNFVQLLFGVNFDIYKYTYWKLMSINKRIVNLLSPKNIFKNIFYIIK
jgi:hypothetical protein